jgi:hypothetical protein
MISIPDLVKISYLIQELQGARHVTQIQDHDTISLFLLIYKE